MELELSYGASLVKANGTKKGATLVQQSHPTNTETVLKKSTFVVSTAVGGVAPGTALSTTPPLTLLNPLNSGVNLVIISTYLGYVSGTLGAGTIVYAHNTPQATIPTGGTELVPVRTLITAVRGAGRAFQGSTLSAVPLILKPAYVLGAFLATTALIPGKLEDEVDGAFIIPPATAFVMQGVAAAGTSPLVLLGISWEEVDEN